MRLLDLVNKVEAFEFTFDGMTLRGEWYKWRTTSPSYRKKYAARLAAVPGIPGGASPEETEQAIERITEQVHEITAETLHDTIKTWNAEDEAGQPLPVSIEIFSQLPDLFLEALGSHFRKLREETVNPMKPGNSQSG